MSQYKLQGNWELEQTKRINDWKISSYFCNLVDAQNKVFFSGAYKVVITDINGVHPNKTKMWKGETAWSDAARYFEDSCLKMHRENR